MICGMFVMLPVLLASHAADDPAADQTPVCPRPVRGGRRRAQRRGDGAARIPEKQTGLGSAKRRDERVRRPLRPRPAAHTHWTGKEFVSRHVATTLQALFHSSKFSEFIIWAV